MPTEDDDSFNRHRNQAPKPAEPSAVRYDELDLTLRRAHDLPDKADRGIIVIEHRQTDEIADAHGLRKARRCIRSSIGIGFSASFMPVGGTMAWATTKTASVAATGVAAFDGAIKSIAKPSTKKPLDKGTDHRTPASLDSVKLRIRACFGGFESGDSLSGLAERVYRD
jgi:hypothetical protein